MSMKNKKVYYFVIAVLVLAVIAAYFYWRTNRAVAPAKDVSPAAEGTSGLLPATLPQASTSPATGTPAQAAHKATTTPAPLDKAVYSDGSEMEPFGPDIMVSEVVYDGTKFNPSSLSIKAGDVVIFKNKGTTAFWPASNPHPAHTDYPEFDAKAAIAPGGSFQFKFLKAGSWGYHNHLNPQATGVINVSK